ncbi:hypothetical protein C1S99_01970 [Vibrio parahaemolyticus]|nr:hypothetical protein HC02_23120 [Vibrio parahaemolyticus]PMS43494.1 hypothetical protein C1T12_06330 [Vibrio parahaemolyticus]PMS62512.1 hypothetical protein C1S91_14240 [Vibrio parahaemolyticus]PMS69746.1 hypothetical protein C1S96_04250 [Vibrio parahaemolyticus]PMS74586.1 hypothetical protein C1T10_08310 [Vibrio parahaemolyticus]
MIQEPTDSTFRKKVATSTERCLKAKIWLLLARKLTSRNFSKHRLSVNLPFPHFAPEMFQLPNTVLNEALHELLHVLWFE